jgi:ribosomal protein L6P/L9E
MSRIGNKPIPLPKGVTIDLNSNTNTDVVKGPKGTL